MIDLRFEVPLAPHPKARPRSRTMWRLGKDIRTKHFRGAKPFKQIYTPDKTQRWEKRFAELALELASPEAMIAEAVRVDIFAILSRPADMRRAVDPPGWVWAPFSKADRDNVEKSVLDALTVKERGRYAHEGFWRRDSIVCLGESALVYAEKGGHARVRLGIRSIAHIQPEHTAAAMLLRCEWDGCRRIPTDGAFCEEHDQAVLGEQHLSSPVDELDSEHLERRTA